jgi:hypothetical protein
VRVRGGSEGSKLEVNVDPRKGVAKYAYTNTSPTWPDCCILTWIHLVLFVSSTTNNRRAGKR